MDEPASSAPGADRFSSSDASPANRPGAPQSARDVPDAVVAGAGSAFTRRGLMNIVAPIALASAMTTTALAALAADDPVFELIAAKRAADAIYAAACDVLSDAERRYGVNSDEADAAFEAGGPACHSAYEAGWPLATTPPTTFAGILAVLRFVNEIEDAGMEWPDADLIGPEGWHYQLRATIAASIETIIRRRT
ncbi:hypothetical protein [Bradyrhizobium sp. SZCCHNS2002]|uniref:hypothetical protein n=1 Tax=Bradyrhizobium sp. SZCCHNS2002 TaxID=3057302 RepID=UPI0029160E06|nr:hypothetical protein [Bradyrhizobium sp. SZCCHNS2002]